MTARRRTRRPTVRGRRPLVLAVGLALALVLASCGAGSGATATTEGRGDQPVAGGKLVYGVAFDANAWTPFVDRWLESAQIVAQAFYEPLMTYDDRGRVVPYLAESLTPNPEFTEWTLTLRPGVTFHDGAPLDAEAVKANFDKHGAGTGSNLSPLLFVQRVEAVDPATVRITMSEPWASFPGALTGQLGNQAGFMASPALVADDAPGAKPVGTGPFVADDWVPGVVLRGHRNPTYWQRGLPRLDAVEFRFIPDASERVAALDKGTVDAITAGDLDPTTLSGADHEVVVGDTDPVERFLVLNTARPPLDDVRVREALARATDLPALVAKVGGPGAASADSPFAPTSPWHVASGQPTFDPDGARRLIAEHRAEHPGPLAIELRGASSAEVVQIQQVLAEQWSAVGIEVRVATTELRRVPVDTAMGDFDVMVFQKFNGLDADTFATFAASARINPLGAPSLNLPRLGDAELDDAFAVARRTNDPAAVTAAAGTVQQRMARTLGFLWLYWQPSRVAMSSDVRDLVDAPLPDGGRAALLVSGRHPFTRAWLDR